VDRVRRREQQVGSPIDLVGQPLLGVVEVHGGHSTGCPRPPRGGHRARPGG
jgi:hypothetical protein